VAFSPLRVKACVVGWCIEIMQAFFLVADDIMDSSITRRGKPCWFRLDDVKMDAINDSFILESFIYFLLKAYFASDPALHYSLVDLFQEVVYQTELGQLLDLTSQPQGERPPNILETFTWENYRRIVVHKTAIYTIYLPIAAGMYLTGFTSERQLGAARAIATEMGIKFQIEDDYLDCFQDPKILGKIGTDIQDHKNTWLAQLILRLMRERNLQTERKLFEEHYGKKEDSHVQIIKDLYRRLGAPEAYEKQEEESYKRIQEMVSGARDVLPEAIFLPILKKIHRREK